MKSTNNITIITLDEPNIEDFAAARNRELKKAKTDWVLFVDSDETISPELEQEIKHAISAPQFDAYALKRRDHFLGQELTHGENAANRFVRLARRSWGKWERPVHETWVGQGGVGELNHPIHHQLSSIREIIDKLNTYSTLDATFRHKSGQRSSLFHLTFFPFAKFFQNFLLRRGFLDGPPGTIMAILMSFHSFLTWSKLYLLDKSS